MLQVQRFIEGKIPTRITIGYGMCVDFRKLNKWTRKDHYPLPFIGEILESLANNSYFHCFDGYASTCYLAIRMLFRTKKLCLRMLVHVREKKLLLQTSWYLFIITYKFVFKLWCQLFITSSLDDVPPVITTIRLLSSPKNNKRC